MPRVLIAGYYGYGNAGDEAMLAAIVRSLRAQAPDLDIAVLSADPELTARTFSVEAVKRLDLRAVFRAIRRADLVLMGGGSLLQDVTSRRNMVYYLGVAELARLRGRPAMLFANGIGPVRTASGRLLMRVLANRLRLITVRDEASLEELKRLGVTRPRIELSADPALLLPPPSRAAGEFLLRQAGLRDWEGPLVGISVRPWKGSEAAGLAVAQAVDRFCRAHGARAVFLPMQYPGDGEASRQVAAAMETEPFLPAERLDAAELLNIAAAMDLVVGVRFHALVFAALGHVPVVGLAYDPKVDNFLHSLGLRAAAELGAVTEEGLLAAMEAAWAEREAFGQRVDGRLTELQRLAERSVELAVRLAAGESPAPAGAGSAAKAAGADDGERGRGW